MKNTIDRIRYIADNLEDILEEYDIDMSSTEDLMELSEQIKREIFSKYFPELLDYISDPLFIQSINLQSNSLEDIEYFLIVSYSIFPRELYEEICSYYHDKIPDFLDHIPILSKEDIDLLKRIGYDEIEIASSGQYEAGEEATKYLTSMRTDENGNIDPNLQEVLLTKKTECCLFIVIDELRKGNIQPIIEYIQKKYYSKEAIKHVLEIIANEDFSNASIILDKALLVLKEKCSVIDDMSIAKKLISKYGSKYIVFVDNPTEEVVDLADNFSASDYINIEGSYKDSSALLKKFIDKGFYDILTYTHPDAITDEMITFLSQQDIYLGSYFPCQQSLAYNKYLVSQQNDYSHLFFMKDIYDDLEKFDFIYKCLSTYDEMDNQSFSLIYYLLGKTNTFSIPYSISEEVANRIIELGFTFDDYVRGKGRNEILLNIFKSRGETKAFLAICEHMTREQIQNASYSDYLEIKKINPDFYFATEVIIKFIEEGHYDVLDQLNDWNRRSVMGHFEKIITSYDDYAMLPEPIKKFLPVSEKYMLLSLEQARECLLREGPSIQRVSQAIHAGMTYEELISYLVDEKRYIPISQGISFLKSGHRDALLYVQNSYEKDYEELVEVFYKIYGGELPTEEEWKSFPYSLQTSFVDVYMKHQKYEIVQLNNYALSKWDNRARETLRSQEYGMEQFMQTPILDGMVILSFVNEENIEQLVEKVNQMGNKVKNAQDLIISLYRSNIPKESLQRVIDVCEVDLKEILLSLNPEDYKIINYFDYENSYYLSDPFILKVIVDYVDPSKLEELINKKPYMLGNVRMYIISSMIEKGHYHFINYSQMVDPTILKKVALAGYVPKKENLSKSLFGSTSLLDRIETLEFTKEEQERIMSYLPENPRCIIYLLDVLKDQKGIIYDCVLRSPDIFKMLPSEYHKDIELVEKIAKIDLEVIIPYITRFSQDELKRIIKANPKVIDHIRYINPEQIELAFENGYVLNQESTNPILDYAMSNGKEIPQDIWDENNIDKLLARLSRKIYDTRQEEWNSLFDQLYNQTQEKLLAKIILFANNEEIKKQLLLRYGLTSEDYDELSSVVDEKKLQFLIKLRELRNLSREEQLVIINQHLDNSEYISECLSFMNQLGLSEEVVTMAKKRYTQHPLSYIPFIKEEDRDDDFIFTTRKMILENPEENYKLFFYLSELNSDKEIILKVMEYDSSIYSSLTEELKRDDDIIKVYIDKDYSHILYISRDLPNFQELCLSVLQNHGDIYPQFDFWQGDIECLKIAIKTYPDAICYAQEDIVTMDILRTISDFSEVRLELLSPTVLNKILELDTLDLSDDSFTTRILEVILKNNHEIQIPDRVQKRIAIFAQNNPQLVYKRFFSVYSRIQPELLSDEQLETRNHAITVLQEYGKVNTTEKNPVFSYDLITGIYPVFDVENVVALMRYNSGADKELLELIQVDEGKTAQKYFEFIKKYKIFDEDDKQIHYAFRYFSSFKDLILSLLDEELTPQEIENVRKVIMNNNPYQIKTKEELDHYDEIVDHYAQKMLDSDSIYIIKDYFATVFGFKNINSLQTVFSGFQLDNFAQLNFVLHDIEASYGEELANELRYSLEEIKMIMLMKEVIETEDIELLHKILQVNIDKDNHVMDYSDIVNRIIKKTRRIYNYQFNARLSKTGSLQSERHIYQRSIIDHAGVEKKVEYTVIDMEEEPFHFLAHRLYHYDTTMAGFSERLIQDPSLWDRLDGATTLSTSSISDKGFWMLDASDQSGIIYLFDTLPDDFMLYMYGRDLYIEHGGHKLEPTAARNGYTDIDSLNQSTCINHHGSYNEVAGFRAGMRPCAIACTGKEPTEDQIRAADYFHIPIIRFDMNKYNEIKVQRNIQAKENMKEKSTIEDIYTILYSGIVSDLKRDIDYCVECILASYRTKKIDYDELMTQLLKVRELANRISEPDNKQIIRKVELLIQTIAIERKQSPEELIDIEEANMGESGIMYRQRKEGKEYLLKPGVDKKKLKIESFRPEIQKAASRLQSILSPDTSTEVDVLGHERLRVSRQERIELGSNPNLLQDWIERRIDLDPQIMRQLLQEYVVDFLLCNFDCFAGNFLIDRDGNLRGVDKEQSFRFIEDPQTLNPDFSFVPNGSARVPIYKILFERYQAGEIELDLSIIEQKIKEVEEITDAEYREIFRVYAEQLSPNHPEIILDKIIERKHMCTQKMKEFIERIKKEDSYGQGDEK